MKVLSFFVPGTPTKGTVSAATVPKSATEVPIAMPIVTGFAQIGKTTRAVLFVRLARLEKFVLEVVFTLEAGLRKAAPLLDNTENIAVVVDQSPSEGAIKLLTDS